MTGDDDVFRKRMEAQMAPHGVSDWDDVLERAGYRGRQSRRRRWLLAVPMIAVAVGGTAAATGLPSLGDVINGHGFGLGSAEVRETVVARGFSPRVGHWQVLTFRGRGESICLKAKLIDRQPGDRQHEDGGYCAGQGALDSFAAFAVGDQRQAAARGTVVIFGPAPRRARTIVLSSQGRPRQTVVAQHPPGDPSSYWLVAAPPGLFHATVGWRDNHGRLGRSLDVSSRFDEPIAPVTVLEGTAPVAGRWRLNVRQSRRLVDRDSIVEPEGLPCVELTLPAPPGGVSGTSGGCGELREAPGFFKVEQRIPSGLGRAREVLLFGRAPAAATRIELLHRGRIVATTAASRSPRSSRGRFWLLAVPGDRAHGFVRWVGSGRRGPLVRVFGPD